jgi:hypothetical protein
VVVDAEHWPLVSSYKLFVHVRHPVDRRFRNTKGTSVLPQRCPSEQGKEEETMGRGILLWLLGVPIPVIILLWLFFGR